MPPPAPPTGGAAPALRGALRLAEELAEQRLHPLARDDACGTGALGVEDEGGGAEEPAGLVGEVEGGLEEVVEEHLLEPDLLPLDVEELEQVVLQRRPSPALPLLDLALPHLLHLQLHRVVRHVQLRPAPDAAERVHRRLLHAPRIRAVGRRALKVIRVQHYIRDLQHRQQLALT